MATCATYGNKLVLAQADGIFNVTVPRNHPSGWRQGGLENRQRGDIRTGCFIGDAIHISQPLTVDLHDQQLPSPRLTAIKGVTWVPAFTDFKLHDITSGPNDPNREPLNMQFKPGSPAFRAGNNQFITRKLWGIANEPPYFHHGMFTTIREAVESHAGEASASMAAYHALSTSEQDAIIEFLKTLQVIQGTTYLIVDEIGTPRTWRNFPYSFSQHLKGNATDQEVNFNLSITCLLNWAETAYPNLFLPVGANFQNFQDYTYRFYQNTNSYVGVSSLDNHVYYIGQNAGFQDVGALSTWLQKANCN